jgi:hypothetical protein
LAHCEKSTTEGGLGAAEAGVAAATKKADIPDPMSPSAAKAERARRHLLAGALRPPDPEGWRLSTRELFPDPPHLTNMSAPLRSTLTERKARREVEQNPACLSF